jgi:hypothetical protein
VADLRCAAAAIPFRGGHTDLRRRPLLARGGRSCPPDSAAAPSSPVVAGTPSDSTAAVPPPPAVAGTPSDSAGVAQPFPPALAGASSDSAAT